MHLFHHRSQLLCRAFGHGQAVQIDMLKLFRQLKTLVRTADCLGLKAERVFRSGLLALLNSLEMLPRLGNEAELGLRRLVRIKEQTVVLLPQIRMLEGRADLGRFAVVDLVGKGDDAGAARLPEDGVQGADRNAARRDQVAQDIARPDRGQLVCVADKDQGRLLADRLEQGRRQADVKHRAFINNQDISLERILLVALEARALKLQQAVDGLGLQADDPAHALGSPTCAASVTAKMYYSLSI